MTTEFRPRDDTHQRWIDPIAASLDRAGTAVGSCVPPTSEFVRRLAELRRRLSEQRLHLAVLGQFKRGKSTFINGLLAEPLLPTGVIPLTSVPTFIVWGNRPLVRVDYASDRGPDEFRTDDTVAIHDLLFRFVAEQANPENRLGVDRVTLSYPATVLAGGIILIDTPGIGSSHKHNTDAALRILPECDAALFVTSVDPPITEVELQYLGRLRPHVGRLLFLLNKIDHLDLEERLESVEFLRKTLESQSLVEPSGTIFCLSARQGLSAKRSQDPAASGMATIEKHLLHELAEEKMRLLGIAVTRRAQDVLAESGHSRTYPERSLSKLERCSRLIASVRMLSSTQCAEHRPRRSIFPSPRLRPMTLSITARSRIGSPRIGAAVSSPLRRCSSIDYCRIGFALLGPKPDSCARLRTSWRATRRICVGRCCAESTRRSIARPRSSRRDSTKRSPRQRES
jgi:GTP-binding protein EngB required for normal cell division